MDGHNPFRDGRRLLPLKLLASSVFGGEFLGAFQYQNERFREWSHAGCEFRFLRWLGAFHHQCHQQRRDGAIGRIEYRSHTPPGGLMHHSRWRGDQWRAVLIVLRRGQRPAASPTRLATTAYKPTM